MRLTADMLTEESIRKLTPPDVNDPAEVEKMTAITVKMLSIDAPLARYATSLDEGVYGAFMLGLECGVILGSEEEVLGT